MVHVSEHVHAALRVAPGLPSHAVNDSRSPGGCSDLTGFEHFEREGVVGLIAGTIRDRDAGRQAEFLRCVRPESALLAESRYDVRKQGRCEPEIVHQGFRDPVGFEVPENPFRQAGSSRTCHSRHLHGGIVAGKHDLPDAGIDIGFVILDPLELGRGKISGGVQQPAQAEPGADIFERPVADRDGPAVAPDDGRA